MDDLIKIGHYIVIQKHKYKKIHKLNKPGSSVTLGRDSINLSGIEGSPYFSIFKMIPSSKKGREFRLELADETVELKDEIEIKSSGVDNRNIIDDGRSQKLTKDEIDQLALDANKASDIVETLISNSNTFHSKTEYSQQKYLKKKEKKYFEYLQILRPNLRIVADVMYKLEPGKIQNLRIDTLSQIITYSNIQSEGNHLLYDSGSNGLLAAALMNAIGANTNGKLVHMHPGNMSQKQALLAMNFSEEQMKRCISVNVYSVLRQYYQGIDTNDKNTASNASDKPGTNVENDINSVIIDKQVVEKPRINVNNDNESKMDVTDESNRELTVNSCLSESNVHPELKRKAEQTDNNNEVENKIAKQNDVKDNSSKREDNNTENSLENITEPSTDNSESSNTQNGSQYPEPKKPKWHFDNIAASEILSQKMDSLVIACKEDPQSIFLELLPLVKSGRPFVVYYPVVEPLTNLYIVLKSNANVAALKLTCNWMRNYQILPERTHPEVTMNAQSGFLLTGYVLKN